MKQKIIFIAPANKGGTYFFYKNLYDYLKKNYSDRFDLIFCNSTSCYFKMHFIKADYIFSIIPFLFKPPFVKNFIFNLHGDYKIERKSKGFGIKLLYLSEFNLYFCDKIMLTSYYLSDKLNFTKLYFKKIFIFPLFIDSFPKIDNNQLDLKNIQLLTISSSNFIEKGMGIYHLAKKIFPIKDINLTWNIIIYGDENNRKIILDKISNLKKEKNINTKFIFNFLDKKSLDKMYKQSDIFVYSSNSDTWGYVIMEACSFGKPIILLENDLWKYIYPDYFLSSDNFLYSLKDKIKNYNYYSQKTLNFSKQFDKSILIEKFVKDFFNQV